MAKCEEWGKAMIVEPRSGGQILGDRFWGLRVRPPQETRGFWSSGCGGKILGGRFSGLRIRKEFLRNMCMMVDGDDGWCV